MDKPIGYTGASAAESAIGIKGGVQPAAQPSMQKGHEQPVYSKDVSKDVEKMNNLHASKPLPGVIPNSEQE